MQDKNYFQYERLDTIEDIHKKIQECEGRHTQTVAFSIFHDALTQICFGCKKIRTTIYIKQDSAWDNATNPFTRK